VSVVEAAVAPRALIRECPKGHVSAAPFAPLPHRCPVCRCHCVSTWRYRTRPFRDALQKSELSGQDVDRLCGWDRDHGGYTTRLLGMRTWMSSRRSKKTGERYVTRASTLSYENAARIARALHLDFVEWEI